jgi:hypothetical protein
MLRPHHPLPCPRCPPARVDRGRPVPGRVLVDCAYSAWTGTGSFAAPPSLLARTAGCTGARVPASPSPGRRPSTVWRSDRVLRTSRSSTRTRVGRRTPLARACRRFAEDAGSARCHVVRVWYRCAVPAKRYQVFLSSTFKDLQEERVAVTQALLKTQRCIPAGMENFPSSGRPPWAVITSQLDVSDYVVLVIAGRYGSVTEDGVSFTEAEYDYATSRGIPVLAFLHADPMSLSASMVETDKKAKVALDQFRAKVQANTTSFWTSASDLAHAVTNSLWQAFDDQPRPGWVRGELNDNCSEGVVAASGLDLEVLPLTTGRQPLRRTVADPRRVDAYVAAAVGDLLEMLPQEAVDDRTRIFGASVNRQSPNSLASLFNQRPEDRSPEQYQSQVDAYKSALYELLPKALDLSAAKELPRFGVSIRNRSVKNYTDVRLVLYIPGDVRGSEPAESDDNPLELLPDAPRGWGPYVSSPSFGGIEMPYFHPTPLNLGPSVEIDNGGSVKLTYPPVHLRPGAKEDLVD